MRQRRQISRGQKGLTADDVETILKRVESEDYGVIAEDYGISRVMVHYIATGKKWSLLTRKQMIALPGGFLTITCTYDPRQIPSQTLDWVKHVMQDVEKHENREEERT